ncbi:MAG: hypothetical protein IKW85_09440 [Muribaculaceae bacterium]|nr:hypothetical protein [Muribaculaceae bacterium]
MKKTLLFLSLVCLPLMLFAQGKLTAYYANCDFDNYTKGQLIVDSNDPINRMVDYSTTKYKYEGDDTGEYYSSLILKSRVTVKQYQMSPLPVELVKDGATFVSPDGDEVRIFLANINGHKFYSYSDDGELRKYYDAAQTKAHQQYYAIRYVFRNEIWPEGYCFEDPLEVEDGIIKLYVDGRTLRFCSYSDPGDVRYRPYMLGFLEEQWMSTEEEYMEKQAYDDHGNLLTDVVEIVDIAPYWSIAYIADEDAIYINGKLHYRQ